MGEEMVSEAMLAALTERVGGAVDDIKEMKGKVDAMHTVTQRLSVMERDIAEVNNKAVIALDKTDRISDAINALKDGVINPINARISQSDTEIRTNRKWWKVIGAIAVAVPGALTAAGFIWKPWQTDLDTARRARDEELAKFKDRAGANQQDDDRRLSVLEWRMNNVDGKGSK